MNKFLTGLTCLFIGLGPIAATAGGWVLDGANSSVAFGSIKKDSVGESHMFGGLSGTVDDDGNVGVDITLASVQTQIEIRDERIVEHVFSNMTIAGVTAKVDMAALEKLAVGDMMPVEVEANLALLGNTVDFDAPMIAARLGEARVMLVSDGMVFLSTEELGIDAGIDKLKELADLPDITRTVPVTVRLVFEKK